MKKTMSKKIVAIMVCTAALAGIYGEPGVRREFVQRQSK